MSDPNPNNVSAFPGQRLLMPYLRRMADVIPERVRWLSRGRLAEGKITILDGDPGLGKSTLMLDWAARITRGEALPDGEAGRPRSVLVLSAEDGERDTVRPRLAAAGADLARVFTFWMRDEDGEEYLAGIPHDLAALMGQVEATDAALVVVDPLMAFLAGDVKSNNDQDVRRALSPLSSGLERTGAACLISRHLNKAIGMASLYRGGGSIGIIGAARFGLLVAKDPEDETGLRRILAVQKCNIGPEQPSLAYRLEGVSGTDVARVVWEGASHHRASALTASPRTEGERSAAEEAKAWLHEQLGDGPVTVKELQRQAREDGINWRQVEGIKSALGVGSGRRGFGRGSSFSWWLPNVTVHGARPHTPQQIARPTPPYSAAPADKESRIDMPDSPYSAYSAGDAEYGDPFAEEDRDE